MKRPLFLLLPLIGLLSLGAGPASARDDATPFHRCVDAALAQKPGKVLEVELETHKGKEIYEIDIAGNDGKRWELKCDLETAKIIRAEIDD
ncbi:MAG: PepSY domain-containing protein [Burkholderiales bacterium]|nr:PepSY domain-containing protein [Burkholderiales bacterium]